MVVLFRGQSSSGASVPALCHGPSTFLSTATKRYQSAALLHPAIAAFVHPCTSMPPRFPAVSCASRPSRGAADTSLRDGRRRPSMACPFGLIPAGPAMLGRAKGVSVVARRQVWWEVAWKLTPLFAPTLRWKYSFALVNAALASCVALPPPSVESSALASCVALPPPSVESSALPPCLTQNGGNLSSYGTVLSSYIFL